MALPSPLDILKTVPVVPVLTIDAHVDAVSLGRALADGGLTVLEITLRTRSALEAVGSLRQALPNCIIGAGTILSASQAKDAVDAGAQFLVSPGTTPKLAAEFAKLTVPVLPGSATVSEMMTLADMGFQVLKFFPAEQSGGAPFLRSVSAPLPSLKFCPTGGIDMAKAHDYLALPNVVCVGGSWVAPAASVKDKDWATVTRLAKAASLLKRG
jgi:2-dehydro-3-deoxyphosphogluconate aldolase/(4S)-4-hydroxy-2-oxoglutarate aldolase